MAMSAASAAWGLSNGLAWPLVALVAATALVQQITGTAAVAQGFLTSVPPEIAGTATALAQLYGGRPGLLGMVRLVRHVVGHLAITGGMAASDSLIQQMLGHGITAKLSAKLGEGLLNGLLTARLGLAAIDDADVLHAELFEHIDDHAGAEDFVVRQLGTRHVDEMKPVLVHARADDLGGLFHGSACGKVART